jgi:uncharacterized repeat protein (TIGR04076 family)
MHVDDKTWQFFQEHLKYSDAEMKQFRDNPVNEAVLSRSAYLANRTIIAEVIEARGCNSLHKAGDKIYFDGSGNLLTGRSPKRICIFLLQPLVQLIYAIHELVYAGVDPDELKFRYAGCFDVGVEHCGWGRVIVKVSVEERGK